MSNASSSNVLPAISNLASSEVQMLKPWEFTPVVPNFKEKKHRKEWLAQEHTEHCLYSGFIGLTPSQRTNKDSNPIHSCVALIADYDSKINDSDLEQMLERAGHYAPTWVHMTPSGGARLVWLLEEPVLIGSWDLLSKVLRVSAKAMDLRGLLPGFDMENAYMNPAIYYDVGHSWMEVEGARKLSRNLVEGWVMKVSDSVKWSGDEIPLDVLQAEMERRFPNRWTGPFEIGARGLRFWDPMADNDTGAIVRPTGMQCFTGPFGFMPWPKIFGAKFCEQYLTAAVGEMVDGIWSDGRLFWYESADGKWESRPEKELVRMLKVERGLSSEKAKGVTYSEVEQALNNIDQHRRVAGAAPFVYKPPGMLEYMGDRHLNTARVKALKPVEALTDWGEGFPWIASFLEDFFNPEEQVYYFLSWLKRFYVSSYEETPQQGQAVFFLGEAGRGKTLTSNLIVSGLMGGHADATKFLLGDTAFNKGLFHNGLWTVDDATPGDNAADHKKFSSLLKKVIANTSFEYHAKFVDPVMVEWCGRVIVTGNLDAESLRILPDCDTSILDKIMFFRVSDKIRVFPPKEQLQSTIAKELPYFAAYLRDFEIPEQCRGTARYGVVSYHHPSLRDAAGESTDAAVLDEILESFLKDRVKNKEPIPWTGTATELMQQLMLDDSIRNMIGRNSVRWLGIQLGKLEARGRGVMSHRAHGRKGYKISLVDS